jgi:beta-aspartyl-dipeptidase (metallo-type)
VTISSDGGGCLPHFDHEGQVTRMGIGSPGALAETLVALLHSGESLEKVLPAFTSNPARLLRLHDKGRVAVGGDADLIALDETGRPRDVMIKGAWFVRDGVPERRGLFEESGP